MNNKYKIHNLIVVILAAIICGCDDFLDITPTGKVIAETGDEYRALLTYVYKYIPEDRGLTILRGDEINASTMNTEDYNAYFDIWSWNDAGKMETTTSFNWRRYYHTIYIANYVIEHRNKITEASEEEISQMVGESYMLRAYMHFLLVNLYAEPYTECNPATTRGIPLQHGAELDEVIKCSSIEKVYESIMSDLDEAAKYMNIEEWESGYNYRFNTISINALRSRAALYMGNWELALSEAKQVLKKKSTLEDMTKSNVLPDNYNSVESILALEEIPSSEIKEIGRPSDKLISLYRSGDMRKSKYFKQITARSFIVIKGGSNEYRCTFRTAEFYLTAAEAALESNNIDEAVNYMKQLMQKRYESKKYEEYTTELTSMSKEELRQAIYDERSRELAYEGHRWFDLRRTGRPAMEKTYKETKYTLTEDDTRYTIPFPVDAIQANPELNNNEFN